MINLSFLEPALKTLAELSSELLIKKSSQAFAIAALCGTACYGIKKISDHDTMEHGYESEIKIGKFETKLKRADLDATDVYIEQNKKRP